MQASKMRFALAAWVELLLFAGCSGSGGGNNSTGFVISGVVSGGIADGVVVALSGTTTGSSSTTGVASIPSPALRMATTPSLLR